MDAINAWVYQLVVVIMIVQTVLTAGGRTGAVGGAGGPIWYVTTSGSDSNPCTISQPCATPTHAANVVASPGDTVNVGSGVYNYGTATAKFTNAGTSGHPITITCAVRDACKITNSYSGSNGTVVWLNAAYLVFDGFEVTTTGSGNNNGIFTDASNISITRNLVHDIPGDCGPNGGGGITIYPANLTNMLIDSNRIYNINWVSGAPSCNHTVVQFDGILAEQTGFTTTTTITNNLIYNVSGGWGILTSTNAGIINNTIFNTVNGCIGLNNAPAGAIVTNNICVYTGLLASDSTYYSGVCTIMNATNSTTTYGYNELAGNHTDNTGNYGTTSGFACGTVVTMPHDITVDPAGGTVFVNWQQNGSGDYSEISGSPTITAGTSSSAPNHDILGNPRPYGGGFDIGAYQIIHTTWYIRADGGNRYTTNVTSGQCDGKADTAYPGSGVNQHCAFNDYRYLWADGTYATGTSFPAWGWVIAGGDDVRVRDCIQYSAPTTPIPGSSGPCRVGYNGPNESTDYFLGIAGDSFNSFPPPIPSGTSSKHTTIMGYNHASCTATSARAMITPGFSVFAGFDIKGSGYVDMACLDFSDQSSCGKAGQITGCSSSTPLDDYANNGFVSANTTNNLTMTDMNFHGFAADCGHGPPGNNFSMLRVVMSGCADSGWNMDDTSGTTGQGNLTLTQVVVYANGCAEQYPHTGAVTLPWGTMYGVADCTGQTTGGYGDGVGTATLSSPTPWHIVVNQSTFAYNTQDGLDMLHALGVGNTKLVTNSLFYGNAGQQLKAGDPQITVYNNLLVGNCSATVQTSPAPVGFLAGAGSRLGPDICRAGASTAAITPSDAAPSFIYFNTMIAADYIGWEIAPPVAGGTCTSACQLTYQNNVFVGWPSSVGWPPGNGQNTNVLFLDAGMPGTVFTNTGSAYDHNATFQSAHGCPDPNYPDTNPICTDPQLVDSSFHQTGFGNMAPASPSSVIVGAGVSISGITTDYNGVARPNPPAMGALQQ